MLPPRLKSLPLAAVIIVLSTVGAYFASHTRSAPLVPPPRPTNSAASLAELYSGNGRFVDSARTSSTDTIHDAERRHLTAREQQPLVAILCCSDSRVCPEFIFDQPAGTIFEIRNAGNVVDEDVMASFEYAVEHLHVPLLLVLSHKGCGAIRAVCEAGDEPLHDHLQELQKHMEGIHPDIVEAHNHYDSQLLDELSLKNARQQALYLLGESAFLRAAVDKHQTQLVYGIYDMDSGCVEIFDRF